MFEKSIQFLPRGFGRDQIQLLMHGGDIELQRIHSGVCKKHKLLGADVIIFQALQIVSETIVINRLAVVFERCVVQ